MIEHRKRQPVSLVEGQAEHRKRHPVLLVKGQVGAQKPYTSKLLNSSVTVRKDIVQHTKLKEIDGRTREGLDECLKPGFRFQ